MLQKTVIKPQLIIKALWKSSNKFKIKKECKSQSQNWLFN